MTAPTLPHQPDLTRHPEVVAFFDPPSNALSYIVRDPDSEACAIIDSVMDFDYAAGRLSHASADRIADTVIERGWRVDWVIETHAHADHLAAGRYLRDRLGGRLAIGHNIVRVQQVWGDLLGEGDGLVRDGSQFDHLFADGERYQVGGLAAFAMDTPGHTPACMTHVIGDAAFVADTLFMPDSGTSRADFPGGGARMLYRSIRRILQLPESTRVFVCHDYGEGGRPIAWETSIGEQLAHNRRVAPDVDEAAFVAWREARDATLPMPRLIFPAVQFNMRGGQVPPPDAAGKVYFKVPVGVL